MAREVDRGKERTEKKWMVRNGEGGPTLLWFMPMQITLGVSFAKFSRREEGDSSRTAFRHRAEVVVMLDARTRCL